MAFILTSKRYQKNCMEWKIRRSNTKMVLLVISLEKTDRFDLGLISLNLKNGNG